LFILLLANNSRRRQRYRDCGRKLLDHDNMRGALSQIPNIWDEQRRWDHGMHDRGRGNMHACMQGGKRMD